MFCDCSVKNTTFNNELINVFNDAKIDYDIKSLIPAFDRKYSGIWQPVFFNDAPADDKKWIKINTTESQCNSPTPDGLGIRDFVTIDNPNLRNWAPSGNLKLKLDWIIDFSNFGHTCKTYTSGVLFWYRYYDMGRSANKDLRLFPGIDLYISNGDMAILNQQPVVTPNLSESLNKIKTSLISAGFDSDEAKLNAAILATGPQIDRITEILSGPDNEIEYERTNLGLLYPQLSGMSNKRYSDIGQNNYIVTKTDLLQKLSTKYGISIFVPESSEAILKSKFLSLTGPNISIDLNGDLYLRDKKQSCGYDISYYLNDEIQLKAYRSDEIFTIKHPPKDPESQLTETQYNINYVKFDDRTIGYHLSEKQSGIFNPNITNVKLHGFGGVDFITSLTRDISCVNSINSTKFDGPYFLQKDSYPSGLDGSPSNIFIKIKTHNNSQFKFGSGINVEYLRSESKPACEPFIKNSETCGCFSLMDLHPQASGKQELSNKEDLLFIPSTSTYYLPSGQYYAGLSASEVSGYAITLPDHPSPGTPLLKSHNPVFPKEMDCSYVIDGCGDKNINFNIDYPGELILTYQSPGAHFSLSWDGETKENEAPYFTSSAGSVCLTKKTQTPSLVSVEVKVPESNPNTQWAIRLSGTQTSYTVQSDKNSVEIKGKKGFFHPNFGWTYDSKYTNKTPIIPDHKDILFQKQSTNNYPSIDISFSIFGIKNNGCRSSSYGKKIITIPYSIRLPTRVIITGGIDDELIIDGVRVESSVGQCRPGHSVNYQFISRKRNFTVEAGDNYPPNAGYGLNIQFRDINDNINYFYNSYAMYNEEYLPGYNFMYSVSGLPLTRRDKMLSSEFIGIKTNGSSYLVTNNFQNIAYDNIESMLLDNVPFEFVDMDYKYGYPYNDFTFKIKDYETLTVNSSNSNERVLNYFDDNDRLGTYLELNSFDEIPIKNISYLNTIVDKNTIDVSPSPEITSGRIRKDTTWSKSVLIYRPHTTYSDEQQIGKWGNMSYGSAALMSKKNESIDFYRKDKFLQKGPWYGEKIDNIWYNNSILRDGITKNTSYSWGCPIAFKNVVYNSEGVTFTQNSNFFPLCRLFNSLNDDGDRRYQVVNYSGALDWDEHNYVDGDKIISKGSVNNKSGHIYLGSLTGPIKITVKLNTTKNIGFLIFKYSGKERIRKELNDVDKNKEIIISFTKNDVLPIYGELVIEKNTAIFCSDDPNPVIETYKVEVDLTTESILNSARISYYHHEPNPPLIGQSSTVAINDDTNSLKQSKEYIRSLNKDFSSFLDLHIFEPDRLKQPILGPSGIIYFEDFFQPKSQDYISNKMEVPYSNDLYWINILNNAQWNILTTKGILLAPNTTYKILKKLEYECEGDSSKCSEKYPENICDTVYEIKESDIYDAFGLVGSDKDLVDIREITFPARCYSINNCCKTEEECKSEDCGQYTDQADIDRCYKDRETCLSERKSCLEKEQEEKDDCKKFWEEDYKYNISCKDICPTGSISGNINIKTLEYYIFRVKDELIPALTGMQEVELSFLPQSGMIDIPCADLSFSNIGSTFLYNYSCSGIQKDCKTIVPKDSSDGSDFVPGTLLDISWLNQKTQFGPNTTPQSVIIENELRYRDTVPHTQIISLPFDEYDPSSTSKYIITHDFNIKSTECVGVGKLFDLSIDSISCQFSLVDNASGLVLRSSCFKDIVLDAKTDLSMMVYKTICDGTWKCDPNGIDEPCEENCQPENCEEWSCEDAAEYIRGINPNYSLVKCEELTLPEDYYLACRQCGNVDCSASISYSDPLARECYCPPGSKLIGNPGQELCEYEYKTLQLKGQDIDYTDYSWVLTNCETTEKTNKATVWPSCFDEVVGPSKESLEEYNNSCPDGKEFVRKTSYEQVISIDSNGINKEQNDLNFAAQKESYRVCCEYEKLQKTYSECMESCQKSYQQCLDAGGENCNQSFAVCQCNCTVNFYNASADLSITGKRYYICNGSCNTSDSVNISAIPNCVSNYYNCEGCFVTSTSTGAACGPAECCSEDNTGCNYKSCQNLEKRLESNIYVFRYICDNGTIRIDYDNSKCVALPLESLGTVNSSYEIMTRKVESYSKTKKNIFSQAKKIENVSTVKVFNKEFKLTYKINQDCDPKCSNDQVCCEQECISEKEICCENKTNINIYLKFEIYDNLIIASINNNTYDKIYHIKPSSSFKCPEITFKSHNDKIYVCNNVESQCLSCYAGAQDV